MYNIDQYVTMTPKTLTLNIYSRIHTLSLYVLQPHA